MKALLFSFFTLLPLIASAFQPASEAAYPRLESDYPEIEWLLDSLYSRESRCSRQDLFLESKDNFHIYVTKIGNPTPSNSAVIILPPTGGMNPLDHLYAFSLCESGIDAYVLTQWTGITQRHLNLGMHAKHFRMAQEAIRLSVDRLSEDYNSIGLFGTSIGSIVINSALDLPNLQKVKAYFGLVSGTENCRIIAESSETYMIEIREQRMQKYKFESMADYSRELCAAFDQYIFKNPPPHIHLGFVLATKDTTVPTRYQKSLIDLWHPEKLITFDSNHIGAIQWMYLAHSPTIVEFFKEHLDGVEPLSQRSLMDFIRKPKTD